MLLIDGRSVWIVHEFLLHQESYKTRKAYQVYLFCMFVSRLQKCRFERLEVQQTCIYSQKINMLMPKVHKTCIYSKNKKNDREKSLSLHILKKVKEQKSQTLCGTDGRRWIGFWLCWSFWVYAGLVTFHYQNFWFFWVHAGFVYFWHQNFDFRWVYASFVHSSQNHAFLASHAGFGEVQVTKPAQGMHFWSEQSSN